MESIKSPRKSLVSDAEWRADYESRQVHYKDAIRYFDNHINEMNRSRKIFITMGAILLVVGIGAVIKLYAGV